jgi:hypothetical protein
MCTVLWWCLLSTYDHVSLALHPWLSFTVVPSVIADRVSVDPIHTHTHAVMFTTCDVCLLCARAVLLTRAVPCCHILTVRPLPGSVLMSCRTSFSWFTSQTRRCQPVPRTLMLYSLSIWSVAWDPAAPVLLPLPLMPMPHSSGQYSNWPQCAHISGTPSRASPPGRAVCSLRSSDPWQVSAQLALITPTSRLYLHACTYYANCLYNILYLSVRSMIDLGVHDWRSALITSNALCPYPISFMPVQWVRQVQISRILENSSKYKFQEFSKFSETSKYILTALINLKSIPDTFLYLTLQCLTPTYLESLINDPYLLILQLIKGLFGLGLIW